MNEKITVVVPAYNIENYIENTVKSICRQTYENLEIIIVDDGSKDNTPQIIDRLAESDTRIQVIHQMNGGVTKARLAGVEIATGEWIGFVDGDDYIEPDMYERLIHNAHRYQADISHCGYQMVFPSRVDYYYNTGIKLEHDHTAGLMELLSGNRIEPGLWNKIYRRELFQEIISLDLMDTSIKITEDYLMNYYLFRGAQKSIYEDFCPYHYILRSGSAATSQLNKNKLSDPLRVFQLIEQDVKDVHELHRIIQDRKMSFLINLATMHLGKQKKLIQPYRTAARKELRYSLRHYLAESKSKKWKIVAIWVAVWPASYGWIHNLYSKLQGTRDKYQIK